MNISRVAVERPVATLMFYLAVILLSFISLRQLSVDLLPDISFPRLSVVTRCQGVAPEEIETLITSRLEAAVKSVPGIRRVESVSKEGLSYMTLEFNWGTNMDFALLHVREKLDSAAYGQLLPQGTESPTIIPLDPQTKPIMILAVSGQGSLLELKEFTEELIKPRLEQIEGIGSAEVAGGLEREIQVEVDPELLPLYGLSIEQISQRIGAFNQNLQGGTIKKGRFKFALRVVGEITSLDEIGAMSLKSTAGRGVVRLADVAKVSDSVKEQEGKTTLNGRESIGLLVRKESGANTVKVTKEATQILGQVRTEYPGVEILIVSEQAKYIQDAITSVQDEIIQGGILAFLVLILFLQEIRTAATIFAVISISVIAAFNLLFFRGITLNIMSLGGLALGVGMLDDAAIVVTENIFRHRSLGKPAREASLIGTREVGPAVASTVFTTIVVFLPVVYVRGVAGQLFRDQALTVTFSLLASMIVSLTLVPMMLSLEFPAGRGKARKGPDADNGKEPGGVSQKGPKSRKAAKILLAPLKGLSWLIYAIPKIIAKAIGFIISLASQLVWLLFHYLSLPFKPLVRGVFRSFNAGYGRFIRKYDRFLLWSLDHKGRVVAASLAFFGLSFVVGLKLPRELMPPMRVSSFDISLKTPVDYSFEQTAEIAAMIERWLGKNADVATFFSQTGVVSGLEAAGPDISVNSVSINVRVKDAGRIDAVIDDLRARLAGHPDLVYSMAKEQSTIAQFLDFTSSRLVLKVKGNDLDRLKAAALDLADRLRTVRGISDINAGIEEGKPEFVIKIKQEALAEFAVSPDEVGRYLVNSVRGRIDTQFQEMEHKYDILVRLESGTRENLEKLLDQVYPYRNGFIPLRELVYYELLRGPKEIRRADQQREVLVTANLRGVKAGRAKPEIQKAIDGMSLPTNYRVDIAGEQEEMSRSFRSLIWAFVLSALLVYMIMAAQFENLIHPFLIMFTIPMGLAGTFLALFVSGLSINVISAIGIIVSVGIVTDNAIVKIDYTNRLRREGMGLRKAIMEGSAVRLRPILMATATTIFGLLPLALGLGEGAELQQPLGVAVMGGLAFSTFLTLILIPILYEWVEEKTAKKKP